jgi:hypothetical protein
MTVQLDVLLRSSVRPTTGRRFRIRGIPDPKARDGLNGAGDASLEWRVTRDFWRASLRAPPKRERPLAPIRWAAGRTEGRRRASGGREPSLPALR